MAEESTNTDNQPAEGSPEAGDRVYRVVYIGSDEKYWSTITSRIESDQGHLSIETEQVQLDEPNIKKIHNTFLTVCFGDFDLLYLDFSQGPSLINYLCNLLRTNNKTKKLKIVGLFDYLTEEEVISESLLNGLQIAHIKCAEIADVVFHGLELAMPGKANPSKYALARFEEEKQLSFFCRLIFVTKDYINIESNVDLTKVDDMIDMTTFLKEEGVVPSIRFEPSTSSKKNMFYHYKSSTSLKYHYFDVSCIPKDELRKILGDDGKPEDLDLSKPKEKVKVFLENWIEQVSENFAPVKLKIMIVDKTYSFIDQIDSLVTDQEFLIKVHSHIDNPEKEIENFGPQLIFLQLEDIVETEEIEGEEEGAVSEEEYVPSRNDITNLKHIVKACKNISGVDPYIIVLNSTVFNSKNLQDEMQYPLIMANSNSFDLDNFKVLTNMLSSKIEKASSEKNKDKLYINRKDNKSIITFERYVAITTMTESEITFSSDLEIPMYTVCGLNFPLPLYFTVVPSHENLPQGKFKFMYRGLIHSLGEEEKKDLRKFVFSVFFRELEEKKKQEKEEFENLNKKVATQRVLDAEEAARVAAEEEAKENEDSDSE